MLTEDKKTRIVNVIQKFKEETEEYVSIESQMDQKNKIIQSKVEELSKVANEERVKEMAEEVLFPGEQKSPSRTRNIEEEIRTLKAETTVLQDRLSHIRTQLTQSMYNLPIPIDLDKHSQQQGRTIFPFFDDLELGEHAMTTMGKLLKIEKLEFQGVTILSDKIVVQSPSVDEGITKLASGIKAYRLKLGEILKAYEQIDVMVERATKSELYARVLIILLAEKKMSALDIAKKLGVTERKVYDSCYNLTRDQWTPNPVERSQSGEWKLTISGEILANRLLEKYPEKAEPQIVKTPSTS